MGSALVGLHMAWRWVQDQEEFVPTNTRHNWKPKDYPWVEVGYFLLGTNSMITSLTGQGAEVKKKVVQY